MLEDIKNREVSYFAKTNFREEGKFFGIYQKDRLLHTYILGKTGVGKTNLLTTLILQDIIHGRSVCVFDVHGDLIHTILEHLPLQRKHDLLLLDIPNPKLDYRYNPLKRVPYEKRSLVASGILDTFKKLWKGAWGIKLEHILRYILLTLLDQERADFTDITRIIHDPSYRQRCVGRVVNADVRRFWEEEFDKYTKNDLIPILNKVGAFLVHPTIKRFLIENPKEISLRYAMDNHKIILVNLNKGSLGIDTSHIMGSLLLNAIMNASFSRIDTKEEERQPVAVFLDEFQNYTTQSIASMLSELRKFKVSLVMAHQYLHQLDADIRNAVLGNVGTIISFRTGHADAKYLEQVFSPEFTASDFTNLENYDIYLKLMINGRPSKGFSATCIHFTSVV
ncbi:MAG: type IV secretory system conjugative DNA transfer family protein [Xanthomarina gelatinilytica]|uniref:type IV secretory system conjugative DNA transfer family protein n=1 Tax=Xanthomarina gelatinilytica TaxID=1137281 RepID=UPI003A84D295